MDKRRFVLIDLEELQNGIASAVTAAIHTPAEPDEQAGLLVYEARICIDAQGQPNQTLNYSCQLQQATPEPPQTHG